MRAGSPGPRRTPRSRPRRSASVAPSRLGVDSASGRTTGLHDDRGRRVSLAQDRQNARTFRQQRRAVRDAGPAVGAVAERDDVGGQRPAARQTRVRRGRAGIAEVDDVEPVRRAATAGQQRRGRWRSSPRSASRRTRASAARRERLRATAERAAAAERRLHALREVDGDDSSAAPPRSRVTCRLPPSRARLRSPGRRARR